MWWLLYVQANNYTSNSEVFRVKLSDAKGYGVMSIDLHLLNPPPCPTVELAYKALQGDFCGTAFNDIQSTMPGTSEHSTVEIANCVFLLYAHSISGGWVEG